MIHIEHYVTSLYTFYYMFMHFLLINGKFLFPSTERILYMRFPFFASFIIFCIWLTFQLSKHRRTESRALDDFWEKEVKANSTRKKTLDHLNYITIPLEKLPFHLLPNHEEITDILQTIRNLSDQKIVNFTGISNTDLKLEYGAPNLTALTSYDQNYTMLARTLNKWGTILIEEGYPDDAQTVLEFAISTNTDVSSTYKQLAQIYQEKKETQKIQELIEQAQQLNSAMRDPIVRTLQEFYLYTDLLDFE